VHGTASWPNRPVPVCPRCCLHPRAHRPVHTGLSPRFQAAPTPGFRAAASVCELSSGQRGTKEPKTARSQLTGNAPAAYRHCWSAAPTVEYLMTTKTTGQPANVPLNGLDASKLQQTVATLRRDTTLAKFEFRARNRWIDGAENRSTIRDFFGAG